MAHLQTVQLSTLEVEGNQLSGSIPEYLAELPLDSLMLENNKFGGEIPEALRNLTTLLAGSNVLEGPA